MVKTFISIVVLFIFTVVVTTIIMITISKPSKAKLIKHRSRYYIAIKRSFLWFKCNNVNDISEYYKSDKPYNYPFKNKKQAESICKKVSENIKNDK